MATKVCPNDPLVQRWFSTVLSKFETRGVRKVTTGISILSYLKDCISDYIRLSKSVLINSLNESFLLFEIIQTKRTGLWQPSVHSDVAF